MAEQDERDLSDPEEWTSQIEQSMVDEPIEETIEEEKPVLTPPPDEEKEALKRQLTAYEEAIRIAGAARAQPAPQAPAAQIPAATQPAYTEQQIREMYEADPVRASAVLASHIADARSQNVEARLSSFQESAARMVESQMRAAHAADFADWADEIGTVMAGFDREHRSNPAAWSAAIEMVRGRHVADLIEREVQKRAATAAEEARAAQTASAGFSAGNRPRAGRTERAAPAAEQTFGLSPEQQKAARGLGMTLKEYAKYV